MDDEEIDVDSLLWTLRAINTLNHDIANGELPGASIRSLTIERAEEFIEQIFQVIAISPSSLKWIPPTVLTDGDGAVSFEWWNADKTLSIFVKPSDEIEYLRSWGANIWNETEDGVITSDDKIPELWVWLAGPPPPPPAATE